MTGRFPFLWALAACGSPDRDPPDHTPAPGSPSDSASTMDTATPPTWIQPCLELPCAPALASASWQGPFQGARGGEALAIVNGFALIGAPVNASTDFNPAAEVHAASLPDLIPIGSWISEEGVADYAGNAIAATVRSPDNVPLVAVGAHNYQTSSVVGAVYLLEGTPSAAAQSLQQSAVLSFYSPRDVRVGVDLAFAAVGASGAVELLASGPGENPDREGAIYAIDPEARGELLDADALRRISGAVRVGQQFEPWDVDADGQLDVVAAMPDGAGWYPGPWVGDLSWTDRAGAWTWRDPADDLGEKMAAVGDLTGDGTADLVLAAPDHGQPQFRAGRVFVLSPGAAPAGPADELPVQVRGTDLGDGLGYGVSGGDVDGDGQHDLIVAASGVYPGAVAGSVLVFPGPVAGILDRDDAAAVVHGEYLFDMFGRAIEVIDADGDPQADLLIGAFGWPLGAQTGAVYLVPGSALFP